MAGAAFLLLWRPARVEPVRVPVRQPGSPAMVAVGPSEVWRVDRTDAFETYSNGLRIDNRPAVSTHVRSFVAFPAQGARAGAGERLTEPAGIVFRATGNRVPPTAQMMSGAPQLAGESILDAARRERSCNFLVDRFGRVFRIVVESDASARTGGSVWSDETWRYLDLDESFLAVSLETQDAGDPDAEPLTPAEARAAAMLIEVLRSRYGIAASNCVTSAQVAVNPANMQAGGQTDWAAGFPFSQAGLPDNYALALAPVLYFGFEADLAALERTGSPLLAGATLAEERLRAEAAKLGVPVREYRETLQRRYAAYRQAAAALLRRPVR